MPTDVSEDDVAQFFGSIGTIKTDRKTGKLRIFLYTDRNTGAPKGEGTVTYEDPSAAQSAVQWFNGKEFSSGGPIKVGMAMIKAPPGGGFGAENVTINNAAPDAVTRWIRNEFWRIQAHA